MKKNLKNTGFKKLILSAFVLTLGCTKSLLAESDSFQNPRLALNKSYLEKMKTLKLPQNFGITLWAVVPGARSLASAPDGTIFVGTGAFSNPKDRVYRIKDWNKNGVIDSDEVEVFISDLNGPNGVAVRNGSLYVAETNRILKFDGVLTKKHGEILHPKSGITLPQTFPSDAHHGWKFIRFAPPPMDHWLYVPVGAPCNSCKPQNSLYAAIHRIDVTSAKIETIASGVRNTVGFDFHPSTGNLWFTDNGRDLMGDDKPQDELNEITSTGLHFGFPYCHANGILDNLIGFDNVVTSCKVTQSPALTLSPHGAALGMRFYNQKQFGAEFQNQIFIAEHGSWNRTKKIGYRVMTAIKQPNGTLVYSPFVTGWLDSSSQQVWGRPVDVEVLPDGSMLVSDDGIPDDDELPGAIYKIEYSGK